MNLKNNAKYNFLHICLAIIRNRKLKSDDAFEVLEDLFIKYGMPNHIRSYHDAEFTTKAVRSWLSEMGTDLFIGPASPC